MKPLLLLGIALTAAACVRPGDYPISSNCVWSEDETQRTSRETHATNLTRSLSLENAADRRHLRNDAVIAEDMAIRWADKYYGHLPEWDRACADCRESLFKGVATHHNVDVSLVREYSRRRDPLFDSAVILTAGLFYAAACYAIAARIRRRFPQDEPAGFWIMTAFLSLGVSVVGLALGSFWSIVFEELQMGSWHLSYRMNRIPARQHWAVLLFCCIAVFWLAAIYVRQRDFRTRRRGARRVASDLYLD